MEDESIYSQPGGGRVESQQARLGISRERERQAAAKALRRQQRLASEQPGGGEIEGQQEYLGTDIDI